MLTSLNDDDRSLHCISFIIELLEKHQAVLTQAEESLGPRRPPTFLGLNGIQGVGKTTLVATLSTVLRLSPHHLNIVVLSIDDFYLPHDEQLALANAHPHNRLIQHRGVPGTHDVNLGVSVLDALYQGRPTLIPRYDKSAFNGQGDRTDPCSWTEVNPPEHARVDLVILEGWCVGFKALPASELQAKWEASRRQKDEQSRLWRHDVEELNFVNEALRQYNAMTDRLDALIHIDAENLRWVYRWRAQQEVDLRARTGNAMSDIEVIHFVNGYLVENAEVNVKPDYPVYELYLDGLRRGFAPSLTQDAPSKPQLRLLVGEDRRVQSVERL